MRLFSRKGSTREKSDGVVTSPPTEETCAGDALLEEAGRFAAEAVERGGALLTLAQDAAELLSGLEGSCGNTRLKKEYADARASHEGFIDTERMLLEGTPEIRAQYAHTHYEQRTAEVMAKVQEVDVNALAQSGLLTLCKTTMDRMNAAPCAVGLAVGSVLATPPGLAYSHYNTLSAFLNRPSSWERLMDGVARVLKAALMDASGEVLPFVGTAEVLFELTSSQISRDRERMENAKDETERLYVFSDQMLALVRSADMAQDNASRARKFIDKANLGFDDDSEWLKDTLSAL